ncbi:MAG: HPF/RaiA family ribosome-associated protein [Nakamurella sp.]
MSSSIAPPVKASIAAQLRIGAGLTRADHPMIIGLLSNLDLRLAKFAADKTDLELSVKNRNRPGQVTTLECWVVGWPHWIATSTEPELGKALIHVRDRLSRQQNDAKTRREPRTNRHLRVIISPAMAEIS